MEPALHGDLRQRELPGLDESERFLNPLPQDELVRSQADGRAKLAGEMEGADVRLVGQREQREILVQV